MRVGGQDCRGWSGAGVWSGWGDCPGAGGAREPEGEQSAQVHRGNTVVQPQVVEPGPDEPQPPVATRDQPRDRPFDHGPVLAVDGLELRLLRADPMGPLQCIVGMQPQRPSLRQSGSRGGGVSLQVEARTYKRSW